MNTTNHIERTWHTLKYKQLRRRVNKSVHDLLLGLVGAALEEDYYGNLSLIDSFREKEMLGKYLIGVHVSMELHRTHSSQPVCTLPSAPINFTLPFMDAVTCQWT